MRCPRLPIGGSGSKALAAALSLVLGAALAGPPALAQYSAPPLAPLIPDVGGTVHYRITRSVQGDPDAQVSASDLVLRRKTATALTVEGNLAGRPMQLTVLNVASDGSLQIPKNDKSAQGDAQLNDLVAALNRMTQMLAGERYGTRDGWSASVFLTEIPSATAPATVPMAIINANATDFDLRGAGAVALQGQGPGTQPQGSAGGGHHSFHGGYPGGYGGGGGGGAAPSGTPPAYAAAREPLTVTIAFDGKVHQGSIVRLRLSETRAITLDGLPYVNAAGWTIEALR